MLEIRYSLFRFIRRFDFIFLCMIIICHQILLCYILHPSLITTVVSRINMQNDQINCDIFV